MLFGQAGCALGAQQFQSSDHAGADIGGVAGHVGSTGSHSVGGRAHLSGIFSSLGLGGVDDVVGGKDLVLVQDRDGSLGGQRSHGAALHGNAPVSTGGKDGVGEFSIA